MTISYRACSDYEDAVQAAVAERDALQARIAAALCALYPPDWTADPDRIEAARRALTTTEPGTP